MTATAPERAQGETELTPAAAQQHDEDLVLADLLVEEISIDGMCGVY